MSSFFYQNPGHCSCISTTVSLGLQGLLRPNHQAGLKTILSNFFSSYHFHFLSPANPVMCLQYTDFSRTAIGFFVPVLSDGCLKREVSFSLPDIYSVVLLSSPLCSARPTEWRAADGQMGWNGQVEAGQSQSFLLTTIWHTGGGKAISTATAS